MGEAYLDYKKSGSGLNINGIIQDYYVYAGEKVSAGDFVEFVNGVASRTTETSGDIVVSEISECGETISACKLTENKVFVAHKDDDYHLYGIVCTIDGATITKGTETQISSSSYSGYNIKVVALSETSVFIAHSINETSVYLYGNVCTISGATITAGTETRLSGTSKAGSAFSLQLLPNGTVFIAHSYSSNYNLYGMVCTVSGTTITPGTDTPLSTTKYAGSVIDTALLPDGNVFVAHSSSSSYYLYGMVCTISGATITAGTNTNLDADGRGFSAVLLEENKVFIAYKQSNYSYLFAKVCTISGTTITAGTNTQLGVTYEQGYTISTVLLKNGDIFIAHSYRKGSNFCLYGMICTVDGTTITPGVDTALNITDYTGNTISSVLLEGENVFIAHSYGSSYHTYAQIWGADAEYNIPTNQITLTEYETQVRPTTSLPCNGVASTDGMGAYNVVEYVVAEGESVNSGDCVEIGEEVVIGDIIPKTWTEVTAGTEYSSNGTILSASNYRGSGFELYRAFDGDVDTYYSTKSGGGTEVVLQFPNPVKITKMKIKVLCGGSVTQYIVQGSNNGLIYTDLYTGTENNNELVEIELTTTGRYSYYRVYAGGATSSYSLLYEWQVSEYYRDVVKKSTDSSYTALQSGTAGDTIQIMVPVSNEESTAHKDVVSVYVPEV